MVLVIILFYSGFNSLPVKKERKGKDGAKNYHCANVLRIADTRVFCGFCLLIQGYFKG